MTVELLPQDLRGKVAIVTGASAGIGRAIATTLGTAGAKVVCVGRDESRLGETVRAIEAAGGEAEAALADLALTDDACASLVGRVLERFGRVDVVVHNAGVFEFGPFEETPVASLEEQWATNVRMPYALTQALLPHLEAGSAVVFVGSNVSRIGFPNSAAYSATKGAVEAMARCLAVELAPRGIRVNIVAPGMTRTQMTSRLDEDETLNQAAIAATPAGFIGEPQDIANAVVFLASESSRYVLGATLVVDGGFASA
ncbi:MAG: SDR family oxidoreductase [Nocardioidaceae bacterium]|nr:SDR family oxidoreductase [Nocardioidaceae bacterium]